MRGRTVIIAAALAAPAALAAVSLGGLGAYVSAAMESPGAAAQPTVCQRLAVPSYFLPGPAWDAAVGATPTVRYLILNPASGPGVGRDEAYAATVKRARATGVTVLGYIDTANGERDAGLVVQDIDSYRHWYGVDGIFLDQVSGFAGDVAYYRRIAGQVRTTAGLLLALNPGRYPAESYARLGDVLVTFEGTDVSYRGLLVPDWAKRYSPDRFWHLIYATPEARMPAVLALARARGVANVYVTDGRMANPWKGLPSYWPREAGAVAASNPSTCAG